MIYRTEKPGHPCPTWSAFCGFLLFDRWMGALIFFSRAESFLCQNFRRTRRRLDQQGMRWTHFHYSRNRSRLYLLVSLLPLYKRNNIASFLDIHRGLHDILHKYAFSYLMIWAFLQKRNENVKYFDIWGASRYFERCFNCWIHWQDMMRF